MKTNKYKRCFISLIIIAILVAFDQFTKHLAVSRLMVRGPVVLIRGVLELRYLENIGAAFSMLLGKRTFLLTLTVVFLIAAFWFFIHIPDEKHFRPLSYTIIVLIAGALGNMIDRIANGYVVDFIYFSLIDFPIFNVADIYVTLSVIALIIEILFFYKEEDLRRIFPAKQKK
ncbi:MAG: signal peptidase II [Eubacterium sp.]|nr:signal peptidase II [Eubacterium sp.]